MSKISEDQWKVINCIIDNDLTYAQDLSGYGIEIPYGTYTAWYYRNQDNYTDLLRELAKSKYLSKELKVLNNIADKAQGKSAGFAKIFMESTGHLEKRDVQGVNIQINVSHSIPGDGAVDAEFVAEKFGAEVIDD